MEKADRSLDGTAILCSPSLEQNSILKLGLSEEMPQIAQLRERQQGEKKNQRSHLDYSSEFSSINQSCKGSARWK